MAKSKKEPPVVEEKTPKLVWALAELGRLKRENDKLMLKANLYEALASMLEDRVWPLDAPPNLVWPARTVTTEEHLVIHLSDEHADCNISPAQVNGLESYNFDTACCRAEKLVDAIKTWVTQNLVTHKFTDCWVLANGDHTSGEIHNALAVSEHRNVFNNVLAIGQLHAMMFNDLAAIFPRVHIVGTSGNHGRRTTKKEYTGAHNNWDYLIHKVANLHCANTPNLDFLIPDSWSAVVQINGHGFCISHGDDIKSWNSIPWYGIERKTRRMKALAASFETPIRYFCFGHFHTYASMASIQGETLVNGSFVACDPYSFHALSAYNTPMQLVHGVHAKNGVTWRYPIKIKDVAREEKGPQRYRVTV
jgi:hypothetical protein